MDTKKLSQISDEELENLIADSRPNQYVPGSVYHAYVAEQEKRKYQKLLVALEKQQTARKGSSKKKVSTKTIKRLFASSGNRCAFLGCDANLVTQTGVVVADIAHIEGEKPESARYNLNQPDNERFGYNNLILLCPSHHRLVDGDPKTFTVEVLRQYKQDHENPSKLDLKLVVENKQVKRAVVLENPDRGFQINMLYIYLHNQGSDDIHNFQITLVWPMEGFSTDLWDRTGNFSEKWESLPTEKRYAHKETVCSKEKLMVGQLLVKKFDGQTGKIKYRIYADKIKPMEGEILVTKEINGTC